MGNSEEPLYHTYKDRCAICRFPRDYSWLVSCLSCHEFFCFGMANHFDRPHPKGCNLQSSTEEFSLQQLQANTDVFQRPGSATRESVLAALTKNIGDAAIVRDLLSRVAKERPRRHNPTELHSQALYGGNEKSFTTPGEHRFIVPYGVTALRVTLKGGGQGGYGWVFEKKKKREHKGADGTVVAQIIEVEPFDELVVKVGAGGMGSRRLDKPGEYGEPSSLTRQGEDIPVLSTDPKHSQTGRPTPPSPIAKDHGHGGMVVPIWIFSSKTAILPTSGKSGIVQVSWDL